MWEVLGKENCYVNVWWYYYNNIRPQGTDEARGGQGASTAESAECLVTEGCPRSVDSSALTHPYLGSGTWRCLPEAK